MEKILAIIVEFIKDRFNLSHEQEDYQATIKKLFKK